MNVIRNVMDVIRNVMDVLRNVMDVMDVMRVCNTNIIFINIIIYYRIIEINVRSRSI
jgi:hypothetical protein